MLQRMPPHRHHNDTRMQAPPTDNRPYLQALQIPLDAPPGPLQPTIPSAYANVKSASSSSTFLPHLDLLANSTTTNNAATKTTDIRTTSTRRPTTIESYASGTTAANNTTSAYALATACITPSDTSTSSSSPHRPRYPPMSTTASTLPVTQMDVLHEETMACRISGAGIVGGEVDAVHPI